MSTEHPETLGPYRFETEIGSGGMGAVFRAYDTRLDRRVAIKRILSSADRPDPLVRQRFLREARTAARLSHPTIVQVHDLLNEGGEDWIVMELVEGQPLAELLRGGPLPISRVLKLGHEIAEGLAHAHRQGTIHRDLKVENVMVTPEGHAKILDFGLAKRIWKGAEESAASLTASGAVLGTLRAMSPEQARGLEIGPPSDLFSLGVLLYEIATATRPFEGQNPLDTLTRVCVHQPLPIDSLATDAPPHLSRLIEELLRKEPARRPESAEEVARLLNGLTASRSNASDRDLEDPVETVPPGTNTYALDVPTIDFADSSDASPDGSADESLRAPKPRRISRPTILALVAVVTVAWAAKTSFVWLGAPDIRPESLNAPGDATQRLSTHQLYRRGRELLGTFYRPKDLAASILVFERVLDREPESAPAYAGLSRAFWRRYKTENRDPLWLDRALSHGRKAVELDPYLTDAQVSLALALVYLGRLDEAEAAIKGATILDPGNADIHRVHAEVFKSRGQHQEAATAARAALEKAGHDFDLYNFIATRLVHMNRLEEATELFQRSIELAPESIVAYRNLAGIYHHQGRTREAARMMQKALEIQPKATLYASLGILYFDQGLYRDATLVFEKAVDLPGGSNDYQVWGNLADSYRWTPDRHPQARDAYKRAIELLREQAPQDIDSRSQLALLLTKRGDLEVARRELEAILQAEGLGPSALYRIAVAWELLGQRARSLDALSKALKAGYSLDAVNRDPELTELRADVAFHRLLARLED